MINYMKKSFKIGGIHPPESKLTAAYPIVDVKSPDVVTLMLSQSIGVPAVSEVKPGDYVEARQLVASPGGLVSASLHTPVSGIVKKIEKVRNSQGYFCDAIIIENDFNEPKSSVAEKISDVEFGMILASIEPSEIIQRIDAGGIVGLGGATFPTKVKLLPPNGMHPEVLILNGAECEPYLTCDDALMRTYAKEIVRGAQLLMKAVNVNLCVIGIEDNKVESIRAMSDACNNIDGISVVVLKKKYPQGGEKQLIDAILHRQVHSGDLPVASGAIVDNVATVYAIYNAVCVGMPLTDRILTLTGPSVINPGNYRVKIGTPISEVIAFSGGLPKNTGKVIAGGPMMGKAISNLDAPVTKGLSGILILPKEDSFRRKPMACIRCGRCIDVCPMGLEPYLLALLSKHADYDSAEKNCVMNCIECGSCSYICPSARPLLDYIKNAKTNVSVAMRTRSKK